MAASKNVQILLFKSLISYINYWDKEVVKTLSSKNEYGSYIKELRQENADRFKQPEDYGMPTNLKWYGFPVPKSNEDAMYRKEFLNMELYRNTYEQLEPFLAQLEKASIGVIPKEIIVPTELELGIFSFERAMMGMEGIPGLYSKKHDKYVSVEDGDPVFYDTSGPVIDTDTGKAITLDNLVKKNYAFMISAEKKAPTGGTGTNKDTIITKVIDGVNAIVATSVKDLRDKLAAKGLFAGSKEYNEIFHASCKGSNLDPQGR